MHWGVVNLFCPICGKQIRYDSNRVLATLHHREFGVVCSKPCHDEAEAKYARMVLGKDEEAPKRKIQVWAEGFAATGQCGIAFLLGEYEGDSFEEVVERHIMNHPKYGPYMSSRKSDRTYAYWGCRLFENEQEARASFG